MFLECLERELVWATLDVRQNFKLSHRDFSLASEEIYIQNTIVGVIWVEVEWKVKEEVKMMYLFTSPLNGDIPHESNMHATCLGTQRSLTNEEQVMVVEIHYSKNVTRSALTLAAIVARLLIVTALCHAARRTQSFFQLSKNGHCWCNSSVLVEIYSATQVTSKLLMETAEIFMRQLSQQIYTFSFLWSQILCASIINKYIPKKDSS